MKKLLALLLVLCMAVGLMACTGTPDPTDPSDEPKPSESQNVNDPEPSESKAPEKPYAGKTLQLWGFGTKTSDYLDIANLEKVTSINYNYYQAAAIKEWAADNEVTIEFVNSYNQNAILAAMNGGDKPDLICVTYDNWPISQNVGITKALTAEQKAELDDIIGNTTFTDLITLNGTCYGFNMPWQGTENIWFNATLFETYGKKTPHDYMLEGNWTWETLVQCMKDITIDTDSDGTNDIYGMDIQYLRRMVPMFDHDEDGKLISLLETKYVRDFIEMAYTGLQEGYIQKNSYTYKRVDSPRPAMYLGSGSISNFTAYKDERLKNGEILMKAPVPVYSKDDPYRRILINSIFFAIGANTDEPEAAWDLLKYFTKVCMTYRYEGNYTVLHGFEKPKYYEEGLLKGTSDYSKSFIATLKKVQEAQDATMNTLMADLTETQKTTLWDLMIEPFSKDPYYQINKYTGVDNYLGVVANYDNPPATMIATLKPTLESQIATFNDLYIH